MNEKTFNTAFNIFILAGMLVAVAVSNYFKLQQPEADKVLLVIASIGAVMGVVNTVLSANGKILTFLFGILDVSIYGYVCLHNGILGQFALHWHTASCTASTGRKSPREPSRPSIP